VCSPRESAALVFLCHARRNSSKTLFLLSSDETTVLLKNNVAAKNHWLGLKLIGRKSNIDAIGARVTYQAGDLKRSCMKVGGGSFLSAHDPRMLLGIGSHTKIDWIEIEWPRPSGLKQRLTGLPIDRYITVREALAL
jgi:enediyne biosynthesis protein E4